MATCSTIAEPNVSSRKDAPGVADVRGIGRIEVRETDQCDASSLQAKYIGCGKRIRPFDASGEPMHSAELSKHVARQNFSPCIPANAQNTAITTVTHHRGMATAVNVNSCGYQQ
jgi:hypothetical protein